MISSEWQTLLDQLHDSPSDDLIARAEQHLFATELDAVGRWQLMCALGPLTPSLVTLAPAAIFRPLELPPGYPGDLFNPSLIATSDGFQAIGRTGNYRYHDGRIILSDSASWFQSENYLFRLDQDLAVVSAVHLEDQTDSSLKHPGRFRGFEDLRLLSLNGRLCASATSREHDPDTTCRQVLVSIEEDAITDVGLMSSPLTGHQKNWMPVIDAPGPRFVTDMAPFRLVVWRHDAGTKRTLREHASPPIASHFRGSSQVVPFEDRYLAVIHEVSQPVPGRRIYRHRFIRFDPDWQLEAVSRPFVFRQPGIEYCAGLALSDDRAILGFGTDDQQADFAILPISDVERLLEPLATPPAFRGHQPVAPSFQTGVVTPPDGIRIVSITLTGNNGDVISGALESVVDWVDACLVIDTGVVDDSLERAAEVAGDKLVLRHFPWRNDFAAARNAAFDFAAELDADWAVIVDTDERIVIGTTDLRVRFATATDNAFSIPVQQGTYSKVLFFRLPVHGQYIGPIHEYFAITDGAIGKLAGTSFVADWKPQENAALKYSGYLAGLQAWSVQHPEDPRWHYYIGDTLQILRRYEEAVSSFDRCAGLGGWDEEGAWACYRAAECLIILERFGEAIDRCARGMVIHPGLAELPWLAAFASWKLGHHGKAVAWARLSISMGHFAGEGKRVPRVGFRHPPALYEGPYDVLRFALRALGRGDDADTAETMYQQALAARTGVRSDREQCVTD